MTHWCLCPGRLGCHRPPRSAGCFLLQLRSEPWARPRPWPRLTAVSSAPSHVASPSAPSALRGQVTGELFVLHRGHHRDGLTSAHTGKPGHGSFLSLCTKLLLLAKARVPDTTSRQFVLLPLRSFQQSTAQRRGRVLIPEFIAKMQDYVERPRWATL